MWISLAYRSKELKFDTEVEEATLRITLVARNGLTSTPLSMTLGETIRTESHSVFLDLLMFLMYEL